MGLTKTLAATLFVGQALADLPSIVAKGSKLFYPNGTQFYIKGIAYQQDSAAGGATTGSSTYTDPLADAAACKRDVPIMAAAGTNVIRTYAVDPTKDHSSCMSLLQDAGIYVISDLSSPSQSINRDSPAWDVDLYKRYTDVIDNLSKYSNVIGFFAGNEVTNNNTNTEASVFVKAAVRDTKAYIKKNVSRWMGVGYAANDDADIRANMAQYFNCGPTEQAIDFWGYNIYEWCGQSTFQQSGYSTQVSFFQNYSVPVFFAEYGCNTQGGAAARLFEETTSLYSTDMTGVFSGGIVYMYFEEANDYGLVTVSGDTATPNKGYTSLSSRVAAATPTAVSSAAYSPSNSAAACPGIGTWKASSSLPPTPDSSLCNCMYQSLSCVPASNLNVTAYGDLFGTICGLDSKACSGINVNAQTGVYGAYSMCNSTEKLGYVLDQYYKNQNSASTACSFAGKASLAGSGTVSSSCSSSLSSASAAVSSAATATSTAAASSNVAVPIPMKNLLTIGDMAVGLYVVVAMGVGAIMVAL